MIEIKYGNIFRKGFVNIYESIKELPMRRYIEAKKAFFIASGIGSDKESALKRVKAISTHLNKGDVRNAKIEVENLYKCMYFAFNDSDTIKSALIHLVKDVDGEEFDINKKSHVTKVEKAFENLPFSEIEETLENVKKNSILN